MTQDEIIELAKRAGIKRRSDVFFSKYCDGIYFDELVAFAKLVAEKEREKCANICEEMAIKDKVTNFYKVAANAIRARGQE